MVIQIGLEPTSFQLYAYCFEDSANTGSLVALMGIEPTFNSVMHSGFRKSGHYKAINSCISKLLFLTLQESTGTSDCSNLDIPSYSPEIYPVAFWASFYSLKIDGCQGFRKSIEIPLPDDSHPFTVPSNWSGWSDLN